MTSFLVVPQWQGSGSARAMRLVDGAEAIRGDLPASATRVVDVPLEVGDPHGSGIHRLSSIQLVRERVTEAVAADDDTVIIIGGDCSVEWGAVERFAGTDVALIWLDAHPDIHSPESSRTGAFCGMIVRRLIDDGFAPDLVVLAGTRSYDAAENDYVEAAGIARIPAVEVSARTLVAAVDAAGASAVYIHVDLDVLDPDAIGGIDSPQPFGVSTTQLLEALRGVRARFPLVGAGIAQFAPASRESAEDDLPTILRIVAALSA